MCQVDAVVACWSLTQEVAEWAKFESFYWNDIFLSLNSLNSVKNNLGKTRLINSPSVFIYYRWLQPHYCVEGSALRG